MRLTYRTRLTPWLLAATACTACAHSTLRPSMALIGADGSWTGYVRGCELALRTATTPLHLTDPQVLAAGSTLLLNSDTHDARYSYVHLDTEQASCRVARP